MLILDALTKADCCIQRFNELGPNYYQRIIIEVKGSTSECRATMETDMKLIPSHGLSGI